MLSRLLLARALLSSSSLRKTTVFSKCLEKLPKDTSRAFMYLQTRHKSERLKGIFLYSFYKTLLLLLLMYSITTYSPETVLCVILLLVYKRCVPYRLDSIIEIPKVREEAGDFSSWRQKARQISLEVARQSKASC